jgi:hypothetical protein
MAALDLAVITDFSANGTPLPNYAPDYTGVEFLLQDGDSLSFTIAESQPDSPPPAFMITYDDTTDWAENLFAGTQPFITGRTGAPLFRWIAPG